MIVSYVFFLKSFIVVHFTCKSMINFIQCAVYVSVSFLPMSIRLLQHRLLKSLPFLQWIAFAPLSKSTRHIYVDLFLGSLFCSIDLCVYTTHSWVTCNYRNLETVYTDSFCCLPFQNCFSYSRACAFTSYMIFLKSFRGTFSETYLGQESEAACA